MSTERPIFVAHALCSPHLRKQVQDVAESFNPDWLLPPMNGEVFDSFQECFASIIYFTPVKLVCRYLVLFSILDGG
jgi:hypothetical protein